MDLQLNKTGLSRLFQMKEKKICPVSDPFGKGYLSSVFLRIKLETKCACFENMFVDLQRN